MKKIPLTQGKFALIDDEDFDVVSLFNWYALNDRGVYRAVTNIEIGNKKTTLLYMARLIMNAPKGTMVDHGDHDGLENRRFNLRICTNSQNQMNQRPQKNKTSKYKGVHWNTNEKKWIARINFNKKPILVGTFFEERAAAQAYDIMARKLFGEFAHYNNVGIITPNNDRKGE